MCGEGDDLFLMVCGTRCGRFNWLRCIYTLGEMMRCDTVYTAAKFARKFAVTKKKKKLVADSVITRIMWNSLNKADPSV